MGTLRFAKAVFLLEIFFTWFAEFHKIIRYIPFFEGDTDTRVFISSIVNTNVYFDSIAVAEEQNIITSWRSRQDECSWSDFEFHLLDISAVTHLRVMAN